MRHRLLFFASSAALGIMAWAQEPPAAPEDSRAVSLAAKAMEKLDEVLESPPSAGEEAPVPEKPPSASRENRRAGGSTTAPETAAAPQAGEAEDNEPSAAPPLLPPGQPQEGRGVDMMSRARLDMMVPTGRSHRGVYFPSYGPAQTDRSVIDPVLGSIAGVSAPLESLFESEVVTRLDADHVQFDRAKWLQFDGTAGPDGKPVPKMALEIERGIYDLKNEILMTNQPVRIENRQFVITGNSMLHDRVLGLTRLIGNVHMVFHEETPDSATAEPAAEATDVPASAPDVPALGSPAATTPATFKPQP